MTAPIIRPLDATADLAAVTDLYTRAPDYWLLAEGRCDPAAKAREFFTDCPPGCDPAASHRLGLFLGPRLSGVAELSFGFPRPDDAYLGLMLLAPWAQGQGHGAVFLSEIETRARAARAPHLYLAVLETNPGARAFWLRHGLVPTGLGGTDPDSGQVLHRLGKVL
jgi:GNAT superfamily N-acetyltransferase